MSRERKERKVIILDKNQENRKAVKSTTTSSDATLENQLTYSEKRLEIFFVFTRHYIIRIISIIGYCCLFLIKNLSQKFDKIIASHPFC